MPPRRTIGMKAESARGPRRTRRRPRLPSATAGRTTLRLWVALSRALGRGSPPGNVPRVHRAAGPKVVARTISTRSPRTRDLGLEPREGVSVTASAPSNSKRSQRTSCPEKPRRVTTTGPSTAHPRPSLRYVRPHVLHFRTKRLTGAPASPSATTGPRHSADAHMSNVEGDRNWLAVGSNRVELDNDAAVGAPAHRTRLGGRSDDTWTG